MEEKLQELNKIIEAYMTGTKNDTSLALLITLVLKNYEVNPIGENLKEWDKEFFNYLYDYLAIIREASKISLTIKII